jgi:hypothetical protein
MEATGQQDNQLIKWGTIAQQKVEAPAEGFGKAERAADKRRRRDESGATTMMTILQASLQQSGPARHSNQPYAERAGRNGRCLIAVIVVGGSNGGVRRAPSVEGRGELHRRTLPS